MITQTLKLNLIPGQVLPRVNVSQYDAGTRTLQMLLYNGDQAFNISAGLGGFVQGTKPDRTGFQYAATVTEGSNVVTLVITQQMTAVSGEVTCELVIANGDDRIATVNFILYVEPAALADDTVISETELPLIEEAAELAQRIDGITADVEADADRAEAAVEHYPYIGANGNWYVFDLQTEQFVDTTIAATGPQGPQGNDGPTGPQGPTGPTGNGIVSITKTGTSGLVDTYTILFTDGTTTTFTVTNGQDGQGSGDMTKAVYDSTNAVADAGGIVAYVAAHSGAGTLAGLDDVTLSSLAAGDTLIYNATTQKWENSTVIQTLTNQVKDMNNVYGSKNLLPFNLAGIIANNTLGTWSGNNYTVSGVTYTVNNDGSITANGTATANTFIELISATDLSGLSNKYGVMVMNGCPSGGGTSSYIITTYNGTSFFTDDGDGVELPQGTYINGLRASIRNGYTAENVKFYPMLRLASITDYTYEPYAKTNQQLTQDTTGLLDNTEVNGAVNILPNKATSRVNNGITFTVNDDGTITIDGTASARATLLIYQENAEKWLKQKTAYKATVGNSVFGALTPQDCFVQLFRDGSPYPVIATFNGSAFIVPDSYFNISQTLSVQIVIKEGVTVTNQTIKPMISVASYNGDYVPYAKSNRELTENVKELTVTTGQIARLVSFSSLTAYIARKYGKVVELTFAGTLSEAVNRWATFLTVPDGFRPSHYVQIVSFNTYNGCKNLQLAPSGDIQPGDDLAVGDYIRFTVTYIID